jgi:AAA+ ATPase superfamily predicted ATPase
MEKIENPFLVSGYESPEYFCDRKQETADLMETLSNGRNVMLTSPRRMGKTGLIKHTFHLLKQQNRDITTIYIDLFPTENLADFTQVFASAVLGELDSNPMKILKKAADIFKALRPVITYDELTGKPKITLDISKGNESHTLEQVFQYLKQSGKNCYIAFDEFQQIAKYPEQNVEALLRSHIQDLHNTHLIFSGSQAHMLQEMFLSPKRPFYQSTAGKTIETINQDAYYEFASQFFKNQERELSVVIFNDLYQLFEGHTWYIQMILNRLYSKRSRAIESDLVHECISDIINENEYYYQQLLRAYPKGQAKLLKAIAKEKKVKEITSGVFISKYSLTATSSVKTALSRLLDDEVVYRSADGYMIYDRFFGEWLATTF